MPEQFANLAETTLAADYVAGQGFIEVASTSGFPALPTFRVRVSNAGKTVFRVDYIYGSRFYGAAEQNDANANSGDAVTGVLTKAAMERFLQSPDGGAGTERVWMPSGASGAIGWGPVYKWTAPHDFRSWSWINQGTSKFVQPDEESGGAIELHAQWAGGTSVRGRYKALAARPIQYIAGFLPTLVIGEGTVVNISGYGIGLYESGTTKFVLFTASNFNYTNGVAVDSGVIAVQRYSSPTSATTLDKQLIGGTDWPRHGQKRYISPGWFTWLRLTDDGVNITYEYSYDRMLWKLAIKQARTTGMTTAPDSVAVFWLNQGNSGNPDPAHVTNLVSWEERAPGITPSAGALGVSAQQATRTP